MRDPYEILGLRPGANPAEAKAAFRKLAKRYHPDATQGDARSRARFEEVARAYQSLTEIKVAEADPVKTADANTSASPAAEFKPSDMPKAESGFSELFEGLQRRAKNVFRARGEDVFFRLSISFLEAALGASRRVTLAGERALDIRIPPGLADGQQIRLRGQGDEGFGGAEPGDALVTITVEPHSLFRRDGQDIHMNLPVSLPEAVLGARVEAPTIHGPVSVTIPAGSNSGTRLRLKGKGIVLPEQSGDHYVTLELRLPETADSSLVVFLTGWEMDHAYDPRREMPQF